MARAVINYLLWEGGIGGLGVWRVILFVGGGGCETNDSPFGGGAKQITKSF